MKISKRIFQTALALCLAALLLGMAGCSQGSSLKDKAEAFVQKVYTAPTKEFLALEDMMAESTEITPEYGQAIQGAMEALCGDMVDETIMQASDGNLYKEVMLIQQMAVMQDDTYTVDKVEITEHGENQFRYKLTLTADNEKEALGRAGSVQFNDDGRINYFSTEILK